VKYLASLFLLIAMAIPCLAQTPRYPVSASRITDLKQAGAMLQEFAGGYGLTAINARAHLGLSGTLEVTDSKIDIVFDKDYAGYGSVEAAVPQQVFAFSYILVGQDTVDSGGLFYVEFNYKTSKDIIVTLGLRFYPTKRCIGFAALTNAAGVEVSGFVVFFAPAATDVQFLNFISEVKQVFIAAGSVASADDSLKVLVSWANGTWQNPNEQ
jgi:hypothetical protein